MSDIQKHAKPKYLQRSLVTVAAAAAVIVVGVGVINKQDGSIPEKVASTPTSVDGSSALTNSRLAASTKHDVIVHTTSTQTDSSGKPTKGNVESWSDRNNADNYHVIVYGTDGTKSDEAGSATKDGKTIRKDVNYATRTVTMSSGAPGSPYEFDVDFLSGNKTTVVGAEAINGIPATHYRVLNAQDTWADVWISTDDSLPVRYATAQDGVTYTNTFEWLPRTDGAIAAFLPQTPPGFAEKQADFTPAASTIPEAKK